MISLKYLPRYKDLAWLLIKYGRSDLVKQLGIDVPLSKAPATTAAAEELANDLKAMGPTYIKLGQLLSTQLDFLPESFQNVLSQLQDHVEPFPFEEVEKIILSELGVRIKDAFLEFDEEPIAGASLSQVHHAVLHSGVVVAVKVQRPGIQEKIFDDLEMLEELARYFDKKEIGGKNFWEDKIHSLRTSMLNELDFLKEARHQVILSRNLAEFDLITVPLPVEDYTTSRVLTMKYVSSKKITTLHPLEKMEIEGDVLAEELFKAYLKQIFLDGFVHIDPHPGNIYLADTNQLALLDVGMVEHIPPELQQDLLKLLLYIAENRGEEAADIIVKMGHHTDEFKYYKFQEEVADVIAQYQNMNWDEMSIGRQLLKIDRLASQMGLRLPQKFNTLGKTLLNLNGVVKALAPKFNPNAFLRANMDELLQRRMEKLYSKENFYNIFLEVTDFMRRLPLKLNSFLDGFSKNEFKLKVQAIDEKKLMIGFEKVANRIALGLVLAALIIGAALLMRVETSFHIFGYPGLAIILFLMASFGGLLFILNILLYDQKNQ